MAGGGGKLSPSEPPKPRPLFLSDLACPYRWCKEMLTDTRLRTSPGCFGRRYMVAAITRGERLASLSPRRREQKTHNTSFLAFFGFLHFLID